MFDLRRSDVVVILILIILSLGSVSIISYLSGPGLLASSTIQANSEVTNSIPVQDPIIGLEVYEDTIISVQQSTEGLSLIHQNQAGEILREQDILLGPFSNATRFHTGIIHEVFILHIVDLDVLSKSITVILYYLESRQFAKVSVPFLSNSQPYIDHPIIYHNSTDQTLTLMYSGYRFDQTPLSRKLFHLWGITINLVEDSIISYFETPIFREESHGGIFRYQDIYRIEDETPIVIFLYSDGPHTFFEHIDLLSISNSSIGVELTRYYPNCDCIHLQYLKNNHLLAEFGDRTLTLHIDDTTAQWEGSSPVSSWQWATQKNDIVFTTTVRENSVPTIQVIYSSFIRSSIQLYELEISGIKDYHQFQTDIVEIAGNYVYLAGSYVENNGNQQPILLVINLPTLNFLEVTQQNINLQLPLSLMPAGLYLIYIYLRKVPSRSDELYPQEE